jgi:hypothetical protein
MNWFTVTKYQLYNRLYELVHRYEISIIQSSLWTGSPLRNINYTIVFMNWFTVTKYQLYNHLYELVHRSKARTPSKPVDEPRCLRSVSSSRYKTPAVLFIVKCDQMLSVIEERKHLHKKEKIHRYLQKYVTTQQVELVRMHISTNNNSLQL